jgi:hypothetical protein
MEHGHPLPETSAQSPDDLGGKGDLRQEVQHLLTARDRLLHQLHVEFGLARCGDAMKQHGVLAFKPDADLR